MQLRDTQSLIIMNLMVKYRVGVKLKGSLYLESSFNYLIWLFTNSCFVNYQLFVGNISRNLYPTTIDFIGNNYLKGYVLVGDEFPGTSQVGGWLKERIFCTNTIDDSSNSKDGKEFQFDGITLPSLCLTIRTLFLNIVEVYLQHPGQDTIVSRLRNSNS